MKRCDCFKMVLCAWYDKPVLDRRRLLRHTGLFLYFCHVCAPKPYEWISECLVTLRFTWMSPRAQSRTLPLDLTSASFGSFSVWIAQALNPPLKRFDPNVNGCRPGCINLLCICAGVLRLTAVSGHDATTKNPTSGTFGGGKTWFARLSVSVAQQNLQNNYDKSMTQKAKIYA